MRNQTVTVNGKQVVIKEKRVSELRNDVLPKIVGLLDGGLAGVDVKDILPLLEEKISEIVPELSPEDIDNAYPSELENLVQAFIDVNFSGIKKMIPMVSGLIKIGMSKLA